MPDSDVDYLPHAYLPLSDGVLLRQLAEQTPWRQEEVLVWGKRHLQPRLIAWYGDAGCKYTYSGISLTPLPWTALLGELRATLEALAQHSFNSVLLNLYRDHRDSMGLHSDDEPELGPQPVIASLSVGDVRQFVFKHKTRRDVKPVRLELESGSVLLMKGRTQACWKHGIEKQSRPASKRINLTFRRIMPVAASVR